MSPPLAPVKVVPEPGGDTFVIQKNTNSATSFKRDGNRIVQVGKFMYSYGGWTQNPRTSYNDVFRSSGTLTEWEQLPDAPWHPRHCFGVAQLDSSIFILGGDNLHPQFDVWKTSNGVDFQLVTGSLQQTIGNRLLYGVCSHDHELFVIGGQSQLGLNAGLKDVWRSSDGVRWFKIASGLSFLGKNISGAVCSFNGKIWVLGGGYYDHPDSTQRWTNHVYSSEDGFTWNREQDAPWDPRQFADVCVWDNKLWMVGGYNGQNLDDIWYMKADGKWVSFPAPKEFQPRHASGVGVYEDRLIILCGYYHNDCWEINKQE